MSNEVFLISTPAEAEFLGYSGEPTSILYAAAVLWDDVRAGRVIRANGKPLSSEAVKLFAWRGVHRGVWDELSLALAAHRPRVVAVSLCTANSNLALRIARLTKQLSPDSLVIFGGPHEDDIRGVGPPGVEKSADVDVSVGGDGEYILSYLVQQALRMNFFDIETFLRNTDRFAAEIGGLEGSGVVQFQGSPKKIRFSNPLQSQLPRIPRELLVRDRPNLARGFNVIASREGDVKTAQIMTERGCAWNCSFCVEWKGYHARPLDDVIAEIQEARQLGYQALWFEDSTFLWGFGAGTVRGSFQKRRDERIDYVKNLLKFLAQQGMEWGCQTRVDTIEQRFLRDMRNAGCTYVYLGAESASDSQLGEMKKQQSRSEIGKAIGRLREAGIRIGLSTLFGMPTRADPRQSNEDKDSVSVSIDFFASELRKGGIVIVSRNIAAYYPGSERSMQFSKAQEASSLDCPFDYWDGLALRNEHGITSPWNRFEDGAGHHAENVTAQLAQHIVTEGDQKLGPWVIKSYIHPARDHRVPVRVNLSGSANTVCPSHLPPIAFEGLHLHESFATSLESAISTALAADQPSKVLIVGMHLIEEVRQLAYIRRPVDCGAKSERRNFSLLLRTVWDVECEDQLLAQLRRMNLESLRVAAIPTVLPETGGRIDPDKLFEAIRAEGFRGRLILDWSDAVEELLNKQSYGEVFERETTWICDPARAFRPSSHCLTAQGDRMELQSAVQAFARHLHQKMSEPGRDAIRQQESAVRGHREKLISLLTHQVSGMHIVEPGADSAAHILAVRFAGVDQFALVERLWRDHGILTTYIGPLDLVRFQVHAHTREEDVNVAVRSIVELIPSCSLSPKQPPMASPPIEKAALRFAAH